MGEVRVDIELENTIDRERQLLGEVPESAVRRLQIKALTDTGAVMLVLPQEVVERLGLRERGKVIVTYADERKEERPVAGVVTIKSGERSTELNCVVGPPGSEALIGQMFLEATDLLVDCSQQRLVPRPESPFLPLLKLK
jgi:predicted aspartyl protease